MIKAVRLLLFLTTIICQGSFAADRHKSGFKLESFGAGGTIANGFIVGFRHSSYMEYIPNIHYGWEMSTGNARGQRLDGDNLTYGGLSLGYDCPLAKIFFFDTSVLVGFGFGREDALGYSGHSIVLQPEVSLGLTLIEGYRASFGVGYLFMPSVSGFNAPSFTVRLEHTNGQSSSTY